MPDRPLLTTAELDVLGRLRLRLDRRVGTTRAGAHRAIGHGSSLDFDDYRPYQLGDDPRRVDIHAFRRLGRLLVKLYEAEDDVTVELHLDASASMGFGDKAHAMCRLAAALATVVAVQGDRVRLTVLEPDGPRRLPPVRGRGGVGPLLATLTGVRHDLEARASDAIERRLAGRASANVEDPAGIMLRSLRSALGPSRRGPVILCSDLLVAEHASVIEVLGAMRAGGVLLHVLGAADIDPDLTDDPLLVDADDGAEIAAAATPAAVAAFVQRRDAWLSSIADACAVAGVTRVQTVDDDPADAMLGLLAATRVVA